MIKPVVVCRSGLPEVCRIHSRPQGLGQKKMRCKATTKNRWTNDRCLHEAAICGYCTQHWKMKMNIRKEAEELIERIKEIEEESESSS